MNPDFSALFLLICTDLFALILNQKPRPHQTWNYVQVPTGAGPLTKKRTCFERSEQLWSQSVQLNDRTSSCFNALVTQGSERWKRTRKLWWGAAQADHSRLIQIFDKGKDHRAQESRRNCNRNTKEKCLLLTSPKLAETSPFSSPPAWNLMTRASPAKAHRTDSTVRRFASHWRQPWTRQARRRTRGCNV